MSARFQILAKPAWQAIVGHPAIPGLSLDQLRAMDGFFDHITRFGLTEPDTSDFVAFASLGHRAKGLEDLRAGLVKFDEGDPNLVLIDEAHAQIAAKEQNRGTSGKGRAQYSRSVSVAPDDLPADWQAVLAGMNVRREAGDKRAPSPSIQVRMCQKLGQYIMVMRREGLSEELHQEGLTAFYADLSTRSSRHSGEPLRPATLRATWEELERFARYRSTYSAELMAALKQTLETLREEEANEAQLKFGKLHGIGSPPDVVRDALDMLDTAERAATPGKRHKLRNRAAAFALPAILPLRREWDRIVFGETLFWEGDRYRFRGYKPRKTALLDGRREFPGSIHPMMCRFVDAMLLQDNDPRYLPALRDHAEASQRPLFAHPNGAPVSQNYVTSVWHQVAGTGAQIARTLLHDYFGARGEEGTRRAMVMCNQHSRETANSYISTSVGEIELEMASEELLDEFESLEVLR
jgi:hypothetical protein